MSRRCGFTGKGPSVGNNVSHANNKNKRRIQPNLQRKRIWVAELGRFVSVRVSTSAIRSIDKMGLARFLKKNGMTLTDLA